MPKRQHVPLKKRIRLLAASSFIGAFFAYTLSFFLFVTLGEDKIHFVIFALASLIIALLLFFKIRRVLPAAFVSAIVMLAYDMYRFTSSEIAVTTLVACLLLLIASALLFMLIRSEKM